MTERKPSGFVSGLSQVKRGLYARTQALMGLFSDGHSETQ